MHSRTWVVIGTVAFAALLRVLPHPWNFSPVAAMALFAGAHFQNRLAAFAVPLGAMVLSDVVLGFYPEVWVTYLCFALIVVIGMALKHEHTPLKTLSAAAGSSVLFFLMTNLGTWKFQNLYSHDWQGLLTCYTAALPFFQGTFLGDVTYTILLFGMMKLAERKFPVLQSA